MSDLIERLDYMRKVMGADSPQWPIITEAMEEIERLRLKNRELAAMIDEPSEVTIRRQRNEEWR